MTRQSVHHFIYSTEQANPGVSVTYLPTLDQFRVTYAHAGDCARYGAHYVHTADLAEVESTARVLSARLLRGAA